MILLFALRPSDLPLPQLFSNWSWSGEYASGSIVQDAGTGVTNFTKWPGAVSRAEVSSILDLMHTLPLDTDMDTVDGMPTYEMFVDNEALRRGEPSKGQPESVARVELRAALRAVTAPLLDRITPFVRRLYPSACGRADRACTPCYSLIRRYRPGVDRQSHGTHHDGHAIVTVVVSLSDYGREYEGGLYVATQRGGAKQYVALNRGDAVVHRSDLLHGVRVTEPSRLSSRVGSIEAASLPAAGPNPDTGPSRVERWSWILWYRDSADCVDYGHEWFAECALAGNPTCEMLHATKVSDVLHWNALAASHGHNAARVKMARAYLKKLPSSLPYDVDRALSLYRAAAAEGDANAHYGLAEHYAGLDVEVAVSHLESAALGGNPFAMFNLGVVHMGRDVLLSCDWFRASGLPEGYYALSVSLRARGEYAEADRYERRAAVLGYPGRMRDHARERTGLGGASGVKLVLPWKL